LTYEPLLSIDASLPHSITPATTRPRLTFHEQLARAGNSDATYEHRVSLGVEIPLIFFAVTAVSLRAFSRITIKKKLATDDVLIIVGTVRSRGCFIGEESRANAPSAVP
jgi:hypothetical protein